MRSNWNKFLSYFLVPVCGILMALTLWILFALKMPPWFFHGSRGDRLGFIFEFWAKELIAFSLVAILMRFVLKKWFPESFLVFLCIGLPLALMMAVSIMFGAMMG